MAAPAYCLAATVPAGSGHRAAMPVRSADFFLPCRAHVRVPLRIEIYVPQPKRQFVLRMAFLSMDAGGPGRP